MNALLNIPSVIILLTEYWKIFLWLDVGKAHINIRVNYSRNNFDVLGCPNQKLLTYDFLFSLFRQCRLVNHMSHFFEKYILWVPYIVITDSSWLLYFFKNSLGLNQPSGLIGKLLYSFLHSAPRFLISSKLQNTLL